MKISCINLGHFFVATLLSRESDIAYKRKKNSTADSKIDQSCTIHRCSMFHGMINNAIIKIYRNIVKIYFTIILRCCAAVCFFSINLIYKMF